MSDHKQFPTTTIAERAAKTPGPKTVTALLEKVDFPNDYTHIPEVPDQVDRNYYTIAYASEAGPPMEALHIPEFGDVSLGGSATRKRDGVSLDPDYPHVMTFKSFRKRKKLADFYPWWGNGVSLISDRLRNVIEALDPGSLECVKATQDGFTVEQNYWACLPRRNLEAVDATRSHVWVEHTSYTKSDGDTLWSQMIKIYNGAVFDPEVTNGAHHFWDIDLNQWFWSRELIASAHQSGVKGALFQKAGKPVGLPLTPDELKEICDEFAA